MKYLIHVTTFALGLACAGGVSAAQDEPQTRTTTMRDVTVNAMPARYETYVAHLRTGYALHALVGNTRRQFVQAQQAADRSEFLRRQGIAGPPHVTVAIDNSQGGVARQIQLIDGARETVAIVNVYCKRVVQAGGERCRLAVQPMWNDRASRRLAATPPGELQLAALEPRN